MAKLKVYSVFDSKIQAYAQPFFMRTRGEALRGWTDVANSADTSISKYPHDFALMEIAEYDEATGAFSNVSPPLSLGLAVEVKAQPSGSAPLLDEIGRVKSLQGAN